MLYFVMYPSRMELADGLTLQQETTAIGVLIVIFESRPESLPQIASLALRSGTIVILSLNDYS